MPFAPLLILAVGLVIVVGTIVVLRIHAFFGLIGAALVVSLLAPGDWADKVGRVASGFGATAGGIGIVIAMAAVIGMCLVESHAADRIVRAFLRVAGARRGDVALLSSGFVLSIPVFADTVFYLLIPLARSMARRTGHRYGTYLMAVAAGGIVTHSVIPPTPGPLASAANLGVDLGTMMLVGVLVSIPAAAAGLLTASALDSRLALPLRPVGGLDEPKPLSDDELPGLSISLLPIVLPVVLIAANTIVQAAAPTSALRDWTAVMGNPNVALLVATVAALTLYVRHRHPDRETLAVQIERSLMSGGMIILITSAGGAFGAMLQTAGIGDAIERVFADATGTGLTVLLAAFLMSSLLKFAQGSSTVAIITTSAMFGAVVASTNVGFHLVYVAMAIGCGSMVGSWMNDSAFWILSKMGGLTEVETLQTWTPVAAAAGAAGMVATLILALALPLT